MKSEGGHAISRQEKCWLPKRAARFPAKKRCHSLPSLECLGTPLPLLPEGRLLTSEPKFPALVGTRFIQP